MLYIDPKNDIAFRRLFGRESNKDITISLLNSVLGLTEVEVIKDIKFLGTHLFPESTELRESIVDVLCEDQRGQRYIVELQVLKPESFDKRVLYYASKVYVDQLLKGEKYHNLKKVCLIGILNHKMFNYTSEYKTKHQIFDSATDHVSFKDFEFHIIELPKFQKQEDALQTTEDKWIYFLKTAAEVDHMPSKVEELEIKKAYNEMIELKWAPHEREFYQRSLFAVMDREAIMAQAKREAKEEGLQEGIQKVALQMKALGIDFKSIQTATGLTQEALNKLL